MYVPGRFLFNKREKMGLINVCGGLECSTLRLNFSDALFKNYNSTLEFEVSDVLCNINCVQIPSVLRQIHSLQPLHCHPEELKINKQQGTFLLSQR